MHGVGDLLMTMKQVRFFRLKADSKNDLDFEDITLKAGTLLLCIGTNQNTIVFFGGYDLHLNPDTLRKISSFNDV